MSGNEVRIDQAQAAAGVQSWEAADSALGQSVEARLATIRDLEGGSPWGADGAGAQFAADYPEVSGQVRDGVQEHATRLHDLGQGARTAIGASLASDAEQAAPVAQTEGQFSGAPASGGGGGGGASGGGGGGGGASGGGGQASASAVSAFAPAGGGGRGEGSQVVTAGMSSVGGQGGGGRGARGDQVEAVVTDGWAPLDGGQGAGGQGGGDQAVALTSAAAPLQGGSPDAGAQGAGGQQGQGGGEQVVSAAAPLAAGGGEQAVAVPADAGPQGSGGDQAVAMTSEAPPGGGAGGGAGGGGGGAGGGAGGGGGGAVVEASAPVAPSPAVQSSSEQMAWAGEASGQTQAVEWAPAETPGQPVDRAAPFEAAGPASSTPGGESTGQSAGAPMGGGGGGGGAGAGPQGGAGSPGPQSAAVHTELTDLPAEQDDDAPRVSIRDALRGPSS